MSQSSSVFPLSGYEVIRVDSQASDDVVKLDCGPIVFNVLERPTSSSAQLYIVVGGWLEFEGPDFKTKPFLTKAFGTKAAYFRQKKDIVEHIYGVHFDMDEERPGHPVFHMQFRSQIEYSKLVREFYNLDFEFVDRVKDVIRTVRTPTAQMDIFSLVAQIGADHLVGENAGLEVRDAFSKLRKDGSIIKGAAHRMTYLSDPAASKCYRSVHWYEAPAANP